MGAAAITLCSTVLLSWRQGGSYPPSLSLFLCRWKPQRQFLYDFVTQSKPKLEAMTAFQLSGVLWAFARCAEGG